MQVYPWMYSGNNKVGMMDRASTILIKKCHFEPFRCQQKSQILKLLACFLLPVPTKFQSFLFRMEIMYGGVSFACWHIAAAAAAVPPFLHDWRHYWVGGVVTIFISGGPKLRERAALCASSQRKEMPFVAVVAMPNVLFAYQCFSILDTHHYERSIFSWLPLVGCV